MKRFRTVLFRNVRAPGQEMMADWSGAISARSICEGGT